MKVTSLWRNFGNNVFANSNWRCLLIYVSQVRWRAQCCQTELQIRQDAWGSANVAVCTCLSTKPLRPCPQMIEKEHDGHLITMDLSLGSDMKLFWNLHPKPKTVSELKVVLEKIWDNFLQVQLIKLSRVLEIVCMWTVVEDILSIFCTQKSVHTYDVCTLWNSWDSF